MKIEIMDLGLIKVMRNVDGSILPESFCPECGGIMAPTPREEEYDPAFIRYICVKCGYEVDKCQIDRVRLNLRKW